MLCIPVGFCILHYFISYFLYYFFCMIRRLLKFICRLFGPLFQFHLHRWYELFLALKSVYRPVLHVFLSVTLVLVK